MASILDLLRKKDPNMSLEDARSAMSMEPGTNFSSLGEYVPTKEVENTRDNFPMDAPIDPDSAIPNKPPLMGPLSAEVPQEPQIYNDDYDPSMEEKVQEAPVVEKPVHKSVKSPGEDFKSKQQVAIEDIQNQPDNKEEVTVAPIEKEQPKAELDKSLSNQFKAAQEARANAQDTAMWSKIGAQLGGAIGKQSKGVVEGGMNLADMIAKRGDRPMEQLQQQMDFQKQDPSSEYSQAARNFLKQKFNVDLPPGITAEQLSGTFMGPALKSFEADQGRQMAMNKLQSEHSFKDAELKQRLAENHLKLEEAIRNHKDTADIRRQQQEIMKMQYDNKKDENDIKREEKLDKDAHNRLDKLGKLVTAEVSSSRSAFGRAANNVRSADAALNLADQYKGHENDMDSRQIAEFARSLDGLLSSGQPTVSGLEKLIPKTLTGKARSFEEFLTNEPKGAKQAAFIQRAKETIEREKALAQKQISTTQGKLFAPYRDLAEHSKYGQQFNDILPPGITADMVFKKPGKESASDQSNTVNVISPEGKSGTIPRDNLEKAIAKGFKVVQ